MTEARRDPRPWEGAFLDALRAGETQAAAARLAGIHRTTPRDLAQRDPRFAAELALARSAPRAQSSAAPPPPVKTDHKLERFLSLLAETSNVSASAREAGLSTAHAYGRRRDDPAFAQRWSDALAEGYDRLEIDLLERLRSGRLEDVDADGNRRKFDVAAAFRCIAAHRETVAREKGRKTLSEEIVTMKAINARIDEMRRREATAFDRRMAENGIAVVRDDG